MSITLSNAVGFFVFGLALFLAPQVGSVSQDFSAGHVLWLQVMGLVNGGIGALVLGRQLTADLVKPLLGVARVRWVDARKLQGTSSRGDFRTMA